MNKTKLQATCEICKKEISDTESYVCIRRTCQEYADPDFKTATGIAETFEQFFHYDCHDEKTVGS